MNRRKLEPIKDASAIESEFDVDREPRLKSALQEYSMVFDEIQKEKMSSTNISKQILEPKIEYVNDILGQHLLQKELTETFRQFENDISSGKLNHVPQIYSDKFTELREILMKAFYKGNEKEFFKIREKIFEELNYFTIDYKLEETLEMKIRAYFLVYHLIPVYKKNVISSNIALCRGGNAVNKRKK